VGTWGTWVVLATSGDTNAVRQRLADEGFALEGEVRAGGWVRAWGGREPRDDIDDLVQALATDVGPAFGWVVVDSSFAATVAADTSSISRIALDQEAAEAYDIELSEEWLSPDGVERLSRWSSAAPSSVTEGEIQAILARDWVFVEEGVEELLDAMGLAMPLDQEIAAAAGTPATAVAAGGQSVGNPLAAIVFPPADLDDVRADELVGYEAPLSWMRKSIGLGLGESVSWKELRFVPGRSSDFVAIWDRETGQPLPERFRLSPPGEGRAWDAFQKYLEPFHLRQMDVHEMVGYKGRVAHQDIEVSVAGRWLRWSDAPYVLGQGDRFIGIWERSTKMPVERFKTTTRGRDQAETRIHDLLMAAVLRQRQLSGIRRHGQSEALNRPLDVPGLSGQAWTSFTAERWLMTAESVDDGWRPGIPAALPEGEGLFLYTVDGDPEVPQAQLRAVFATEHELAERGHIWNTPERWLDVPESVPRNLFDSVSWVLRRRSSLNS